MITIKVIFFASFKELLDCAQLELSLDEGTNIQDLCLVLSNKGGRWEGLFEQANKNVKVACNQSMAELSTLLSEGDEVAFFPPVTGG